MSKGEMAENVFRALLKELGIHTTEEQGESVLAFKSEECKFTLSVHRREDGKFDKTVLEKTSDEEACKKFTAVVDALTELLKAFPCGDKPKDEEKGEEKSEETPAEGKEEEKKDEGDKEEKAEEEKPAAEE